MRNDRFTALGEVADFINGYPFKPEQWNGRGTRIIRIQNLTDTTKPFNKTDHTVPQKYVVRKNDVLVSWSATLGVFRWPYEEDGLLNQHIFKVVPNTSKAHPDYLAYAIETAIDSMLRFTHGSTMRHINRGEFLNTQIYLPPLSEQRRIAAVLDAADALRAKRRAALGKLDALLQSVFLEMFGDPVRNERGWEVTKLDNVVSYIGSGVTPLGGSSVYSTEGQLFIRSQNVLMFDFDFSDAAYIDDPMHQDMRRTWVKHNDVLLNITGASIGRVNFYSGKDDSANVNQHVCIIRPIDQRILPAYLTYHLGMPSYQNKIIGQNAGATRQAFNFKQIRDFNLMLPPLRLQSRFSDAWEKVRGLRQRQHCAYEKQVRLFHSLQQRAFRGEL